MVCSKRLLRMSRQRLATVEEWEFVAMANENVADARKIEEYNQYILDWYEKPKRLTTKLENFQKLLWCL